MNIVSKYKSKSLSTVQLSNTVVMFVTEVNVASLATETAEDGVLVTASATETIEDSTLLKQQSHYHNNHTVLYWQ